MRTFSTLFLTLLAWDRSRRKPCRPVTFDPALSSANASLSSSLAVV